ncbi:MAG TPA: lytic transglycosylase domain-containing protein [Elusimicrobiota bacterium]|nr:lytic transglycosylase domain-containing protein [Elusimicrobiota bacterium]
MKVLAFLSAVFLAAAPQLSAAQAVQSAKASRQELLNKIDNWEYFFSRNPNNAAKVSGYVSDIDHIGTAVAGIQPNEDINPIEARFQAWQEAVLSALFHKDHASNEKGFEHYLKYLVSSAGNREIRQEKLRQERSTALEKREIAAIRNPGQVFDNGRRREPAPLDVPNFRNPLVRDARNLRTPEVLDAFAPEVQPMTVAPEAVPEPVVQAAPALSAQPYTCASMGNLCPQLLKDGATPKIIQDVLTEAKKSGANPILIFSVMESESSFYAKAKSKAGALGLMQIMPDTGKQMGVRGEKRLFDIKTNIRLGIRYLESLWSDFCDFSMSELNSINPWARADVKKAIAAYNAGPAAVLKYGAVPPYRETRHYVAKVLRNFYELRRAARSQG